MDTATLLACALFMPSPNFAAEQLEENKRIVLSFYDLAFNQYRPEDAVAKYIGPRFLQHNPRIADGAQAFVEYCREFLSLYPRLHTSIKRIIAEHDLVIVHAHWILDENDPGLAVADMFRVESGKITEHWDVAQRVPAAPLNQNGMF
jgi:predicted SnoaL-like aldol condensation-catalyzing enzyme